MEFGWNFGYVNMGSLYSVIEVGVGIVDVVVFV